MLPVMALGMFQKLRRQWKLFLESPPGRRFQDFHDRRHKRRGTRGAGRKKWFMIGGIVIAVAGLALLPLPGPGSIVLAAGLMLVAQESITMARLLDFLDKKRARLMSRARSTCKRWGKAKCALLGACAGALLTAGGIALWLWIES